jgi:integrase
MKVSIHHHPNGKKSYTLPVWEVRWSERDAVGRAATKTAWIKSKREAETLAAEKRRELTAHGAAHATVSQSERAALIRFREWQKATPDAPDLSAVIEAAIAAHTAASESLTVAEAIRLRLDSVERRGLSERHSEDVRLRLAKFEASFGTRQIASITAAEIERWLHKLEVGATTWANYAKVINSIFTTAAKLITLPHNPMKRLEKPREDIAAPAILTPSQVRALLAAAHPSILPLLVLQSFCGVRRAESERLTWADIKLDSNEPFVELHSGITKTNRRRNPTIPDNAADWLRACRGIPGASLGISPNAYRRHLEAAAAAVGIEWSENLLRHSFGTYRLSVTKNAAQVAEEMGNSPGVVRSHYQNVTSPEAARQWFEVRPETKPKAGTILSILSA